MQVLKGLNEVISVQQTPGTLSALPASDGTVCPQIVAFPLVQFTNRDKKLNKIALFFNIDA